MTDDQITELADKIGKNYVEWSSPSSAWQEIATMLSVRERAQLQIIIHAQLCCGDVFSEILPKAFEMAEESFNREEVFP